MTGHDSLVPCVRLRDRTRGHSRAFRAIHAFHSFIRAFAHSRARVDGRRVALR